MFDKIFDSILQDTITFYNILAILITSFVLGFTLSLVYLFIKRKKGYSPSFPLTLIVLPIVVSIIIILVGNNTARAFSLAGIFALTRFRSEQKDTQDITYIFLTVAIGLATGLGYIGYAVLITLFICLILIVIHLTNYSRPSKNIMDLKIIIPENLNFENVFDDIFKKYCKSVYLKKVKSTDFGSTFELKYTITLLNNVSTKEFIDELRTRNGNLNILLTNKRNED